MAVPSAPESPAVVYHHIRVEGAGWLPSSVVNCTFLMHSSVDVKNIQNVLTPSIRRSGRCNRAIDRLPRHCRIPIDIQYRLLRRGGIVNGDNDDYPRHQSTTSVASTDFRYVVGRASFSQDLSNQEYLFCRRSTNWLLRLILQRVLLVQCRFCTTRQSTMASWWLCLWPFLLGRKCETVQSEKSLMTKNGRF